MFSIRHTKPFSEKWSVVKTPSFFSTQCQGKECKELHSHSLHICYRRGAFFKAKLNHFLCHSRLMFSRALEAICGIINPLTPNDHYSGRTTPLTSKRCILYIYSTNTDNEYFKHGIYSPFFFLFKMQFVS